MSQLKNSDEHQDRPQAQTVPFSSFDLKPEILEALKRMKYEIPSPVQAMCYEQASGGDDVIVMAQTGTGKTAGFGIPLVQNADLSKRTIQALVLVPTRELAKQVSAEVSSIGQEAGIVCSPIYGGTSFTDQVAQVKKGVHVVVGTPGRILDHIRRKTISFATIDSLVLDEADEMLSMGFEKELSEILDSLPEDRQTLLFSATLPDNIRRLSKRYMKDSAITIRVSGDTVGAKEISHFVYLVSGTGRVGDLVRVLQVERPKSAIIFCNTRDDTQLVSRALRDNGYNASAISSDLSQADRETVLGNIKKGKLQFLVATDIAARGIDISNLSHVINYAFPDSLESYIHRTGRTGRQGRHGAAISLVSPHELGNLYMLRLTYKIFPVEKELPANEDASRTAQLQALDAVRAEIGDMAISADSFKLAARILQCPDSDRLIAGLIARHLGNNWTASLAPQPDEDGDGEGALVHNVDAQDADSDVVDDTKRDVVSSGNEDAHVPAVSPQLNRSQNTDNEHTASEQRRPQWDVASDTKEIVDSIPDDEEILKKRRRSTQPTVDKKGNVEIFLDAGRKDGLRISSLMKELVERTGLPRGEIGKVRMLTRGTYLTVPEMNAESIFSCLNTLVIEGRDVKPEYS